MFDWLKKITNSKETVPTPIQQVDPNADVVVLNDRGRKSHHYASRQERFDVYRNMVQNPDVDLAVNDITNQAIVNNQMRDTVSVTIDPNTKLSKAQINKLTDAFTHVLTILDFNRKGHNLFKRWYIDGKIHFYIVVDDKKRKDGIVDAILLDPKHLTYISTAQTNAKREFVKYESYYTYNSSVGMNASLLQRVSTVNNGNLILPHESIASAYSGELDKDNRNISFLDKAIRPLNILKQIEDATVKYKLTRSTEKRIFYIDVGVLPPNKAEELVRKAKDAMSTRNVWNPKTGKMESEFDVDAITEDFFLPRSSDGRGSEISTLSGGGSLGELGELEYFKDNLKTALNIPLSRNSREGGGVFSGGMESQITRDELRLSDFIDTLRTNFSDVLIELLRIQCDLTGVMKYDEFEEELANINIVYADNETYSAMREVEKWERKFSSVRDMLELTGENGLISKDWIRRQILGLTDEEIKSIAEQNAKEPKTNDDE